MKKSYLKENLIVAAVSILTMIVLCVCDKEIFNVPKKEMQKGWCEDSKGYYYIDDDGNMLKDTVLTFDDKDYAFDEKGYLYTNQMFLNPKDKTKVSCADGDGVIAKPNAIVSIIGQNYFIDENGFVKINDYVVKGDKKYFFGTDGRQLFNTWLGDNCYLDVNGVAIEDDRYLKVIKTYYDGTFINEYDKNDRKAWTMTPKFLCVSLHDFDKNGVDDLFIFGGNVKKEIKDDNKFSSLDVFNEKNLPYIIKSYTIKDGALEPLNYYSSFTTEGIMFATNDNSLIVNIGVKEKMLKVFDAEADIVTYNDATDKTTGKKICKKDGKVIEKEELIKDLKKLYYKVSCFNK